MKILLICSAGTSTSLVVKKMNEYAALEGKQYEIKSSPGEEAKSEREMTEKYDVLLLGPQLKFRLKEFKETYPNKIVDSIPPMMYGRLDAKGIIKFAEELVK